MKLKMPASLHVISRAVVDWWDGWFDLLIVVVVWLVAQLTVVFGPPATFGLYHVVYQLINGESTGVRGLIEGARKYFGAAWLWNVVNLVVVFILILNVRFYGQFTTDFRYFLQFFMLILIAIWLSGQFYALAIFHEQQEPRTLLAIKNGILMVLAAPFFSAVLLLLALVLVALCVVLVLPIFLAVPAIIPLLGMRAVQNRLIAYGLREPEKTPKEIERERSSRIEVPRRSEISDEER